MAQPGWSRGIRPWRGTQRNRRVSKSRRQAPARRRRADHHADRRVELQGDAGLRRHYAGARTQQGGGERQHCQRERRGDGGDV